MKNKIAKILIISLVAIIFYLFHHFDLYQFLTLEYAKNHLNVFKIYLEANFIQVAFIYLVLYIVALALSVPGATVLSLAGGALFGFWWGLLLISFASSIGSTLAFLVARYIFHDYFQKKFQKNLVTINENMKREGGFYLFTLRLIPLFPLFLINVVMALTNIKTFTFYWVSQIGMLLGTAVYVNAGVQLAQLTSLKGILSPTLIISFTLIGIFPLVAKKMIELLRAKRVYKNYKKPKKFEYNMVVIGAGAAGLVTSYICSAVKAKVAIIEKNKMGGDCLNSGCVPSKALIQSAKVVHYQTRASEFGLNKIDVEFDFKSVMERVQNVIKNVESHDSIERYTALGVDCFEGAAKIISPWEVEINGKILATKNITIATGGEPSIPPINGIEEIGYLTSDSIWDLYELPKKFLVIGAGPIGLELAQAFSRLGSIVTIVHCSANILKKEDSDVASFILSTLINENIKVLTNCSAKKFYYNENQKILRCVYQGSDLDIEFDQVLIATGRKARVKNFGLENLKIPLRKNGTIEANSFLQTSYPNIYVCGDVTGPYQLTHMASHQAWYCAVNGLFGKLKKFRVDYTTVPWCTYTDPEVATVGLNEKSAKETGTSYEVTKYGIDDLDRAIADGEDRGFVKVLTIPGTDKIIGCTIVGAKAGELLLEFISAMKNNIGLNKILSTIHIYPTMGEANKYVAGVWKKNNVNQRTLQYLEKFFNWQR